MQKAAVVFSALIYFLVPSLLAQPNVPQTSPPVPVKAAQKSPCTDEVDLTSKSRLALKECLDPWGAFDKPEPKDDCSAVVRHYVKAARDARRCLASLAQKK